MANSVRHRGCMPLIRRANPSWDYFQELLPGTPTGGPRSDMARGWPTELPDPDSARMMATLPRLSNQPGTTPTGRGRPTRAQLGLGQPSISPTGNPSMGSGRSSIFMAPTY